MSDLRVSNLRGRIAGSSPNLPDGAVVTGVATATSFSGSGDSLSFTNLNIGGNLSVGGTITYEDVTNQDVVGLSTFRAGVEFGVAGAGGTISANGNTTLAGSVTATSFAGDVSGYNELTAPFGTTVTYTVKVITKTAAHRYNGTGSPNGYTIDGVESPYITLTPGRTYKFDQVDGSNATHPIKFYLNADKTGLYEGGVTYNGTAGNAGAYTQIVVNDYTPTVLHYQCASHAYMGNAVNTSSNSAMSAQSGSVTAMAAASVDCRLGNYFTKTISGATTFTFDNPPASGVSYGFTLELTHTGGSSSIGWPGTVKWPADTPPTLTDGKTSLLMFVTDNGGARWRGCSLADYTT